MKSSEIELLYQHLCKNYICPASSNTAGGDLGLYFFEIIKECASASDLGMTFNISKKYIRAGCTCVILYITHTYTIRGVTT